LTTTIEIDPQVLDRDGILTRATADSGVPDRTSSSRENLRASVGLEADDNSVVIISNSLSLRIGHPFENLRKVELRRRSSRISGMRAEFNQRS
jgi:hypothetical protein